VTPAPSSNITGVMRVDKIQGPPTYYRGPRVNIFYYVSGKGPRPGLNTSKDSWMMSQWQVRLRTAISVYFTFYTTGMSAPRNCVVSWIKAWLAGWVVQGGPVELLARHSTWLLSSSPGRLVGRSSLQVSTNPTLCAAASPRSSAAK